MSELDTFINEIPLMSEIEDVEKQLIAWYSLSRDWKFVQSRDGVFDVYYRENGNYERCKGVTFSCLFDCKQFIYLIIRGQVRAR